MPQLQSTDQPTAPLGKDTEQQQQPYYNMITFKVKRPALSSAVR